MPINDWPKRRKVSTLPGVKPDAVTVLARTLDKAQQGELKSVYISLQWKDDSYSSDWSSMQRFELAMHQSFIHNDAQLELWGPER